MKEIREIREGMIGHKIIKVVIFVLPMLGLQIQASNVFINSEKMDTVTLGAGCFWCVEAVFQDLIGVESVASGFSGGNIINPSYREVVNGMTEHAEACQLVYNPDIISFRELMEVFFVTHDPTTLNRQGNDVGTQYRSVIFYHSDEQRRQANEFIEELNNAKVYDVPIVTELSPYKNFFIADNYHQDFFNLNGEQPYCSFIIQPKVEKVKKYFGDKLKKK